MKIDHNEIYSTRLLVFMEIEPQSNKYNQVYFDEENFKKVSLQIGKIVGKEDSGLDRVELSSSEEEYTLPDLKQIN